MEELKKLRAAEESAMTALVDEEMTARFSGDVTLTVRDTPTVLSPRAGGGSATLLCIHPSHFHPAVSKRNHMCTPPVPDFLRQADMHPLCWGKRPGSCPLCISIGQELRGGGWCWCTNKLNPTLGIGLLQCAGGIDLRAQDCHVWCS